MSTKVITGKVRASYANVWTPKAIQEGQEAKYSISLLIPKSDKKTLTAINKAVEVAKEEGKAKWGGKIPATLKLPLRDGDEERPDNPEYAGMYFLNASSLNPPQIVDQAVNPILDQNEFYSGCFCRAAINFYAFSVSGNRGIAVGLNNLQKLADGEKLSGGSTAAKDFGAVEDDDFGLE